MEFIKWRENNTLWYKYHCPSGFFPCDLDSTWVEMLADALTHSRFCSLNSYSKSNFNIVKSFSDGSQNLIEKTAQDYNLNSDIFWDLISECLWGGESLHPFPTSRKSYITSAFAPVSSSISLMTLGTYNSIQFLEGSGWCEHVPDELLTAGLCSVWRYPVSLTALPLTPNDCNIGQDTPKIS